VSAPFGAAATAHAQAGARCFATGAAPESLVVRAEPAAGAAVVRALPRERAASLSLVDAAGDRTGDWLEVRAGDAAGWVSGADLTCRLSAEAAERAVGTQAAEVVAALRDYDLARLRRHAHPIRGVRFSPYAAIDPEEDVVLTAAALPCAARDARQRVWGYDDGTGSPIRLTFRGYYQRFVYDRDFARAPEVTYNGSEVGNQRVWEAYPNAIVVGFAFPETESATAESLRLVFERHHGVWYLSGIVHDGWSI
jgi:hypothetical protein